MNTDHLLDLFNSVEHKLFRDLQRIGAAYTRLCNVENIADSRTSMKELIAAARDMAAQIRRILEVENVPPSEIRNVSAKTLDTLDSQWLNANHFYMRYLHCEREHKLKNLTALYYLIVDVAAVAEETRAEVYYWRKRERS